MASSLKTKEENKMTYRACCMNFGANPIPELEDALDSGDSTCRISRQLLLTTVDAEVFTAALANSAFEEIVLEGVLMPDEGWLMLVLAANSCSLRCLSVSNTPLDLETRAQLSLALGHLSTVQHLCLRNSQIDQDFVSSIVKGPLLSADNSLRTLDLAQNRIGCAGAVALAHAFSTKDLGLRKLDLSYNCVGDDGARALGYALGGSEGPCPAGAALEVLELEGNDIGDMGGIALAAAIHRAPSLARVNLGRNSLGPDAVHAIADSIASGAASLRELVLASSEMGEQAAAHLLEAVGSHGALAALDIRGAPLQSQAARALSDLLACSRCSLRSLRADLGSSELAPEVARAVRENLSLTEIEVGGCADAATALAMQRAAERNRSPPEKQKPGPAPEPSQPQTPVRPEPEGRAAAPPRARRPMPGCSPRKSVQSPRTPAASPDGPIKPVVRASISPAPMSPRSLRVSVGGGGAQAIAGEIFRNCDKNESGYLERDEFRAALRMAGVLVDVKPAVVKPMHCKPDRTSFLPASVAQHRRNFNS